MNDVALPLIAAYDVWDANVREAADDDDGVGIRGYDVGVVDATRALVEVLVTPWDGPLREARYSIAEAVVHHAGALLWGPHFSDSNTDGPCDIEWDCHMLQAVLTPGYIVPEEVMPAYVYGTFFDGPQTYSDDTLIID